MFPGAGDQRDLGHYLALGQIGLEMVAPIALGWLLDSYFGWSPWAVVAGAALGLIGGLAHVVQMTSPKKDSRTRSAGKVRPPDGGSSQERTP